MLQATVDWLLYSVFALDSANKWFQSLNYFIYDSIKIIFILFLAVLAISFVRTYIPLAKIRKALEKGGVFSHFFAALFGALTPFCSCSSIPIFISFIKAKSPLGVAFTFLTTSPLVNEYLVVMMFALFGWKITVAYIIAGMIIGMLTGTILGKLKIKHEVETDMQAGTYKDDQHKTLKAKARFAWGEGLDMIKKLWLWILIAVAIGAAVHNFVPDSAIDGIMRAGGVFTLPLAVLIGVPIYGSCAAILPIAAVLLSKGVPLGTALAFMMSVSALSLPQFIILRRVIKLKMILIFAGIVSVGIVVIGYVLNALQGVLV